ncbi:hypothetical protein TRAPUB_4454 [Trametes pubescens]|uniref:Uncharacterized protein n=1 Tax=Trametes pubescens TaxID=154538 RepID=A0A1M2VB47_TRAPU|nr:hypothetical protein TRAPUB_4454 [Trametes pubescens]
MPYLFYGPLRPPRHSRPGPKVHRGVFRDRKNLYQNLRRRPLPLAALSWYGRGPLLLSRWGRVRGIA